ncbi:MAG: NrfD/PsrC family molybdoenzyme membrane anchor subunit [Phycisphaerales bacterium]|jgi:molybdopterin-containing oxidoreductase family membrane subunit|nr:NrfD/PsrC family molybdoenzyme membrane anchor subunit [Phycisphaerales bacterium]
MTSIHPDKATAERLAGLSAGGVVTSAQREDLGDGTLIETPGVRPPLVLNNRSFGEVTDIVCGYAENPAPKWWLPAFAFAALVAGTGGLLILYLIITGVGTWGLTNQVDWAWDITNFVFWIGIGHAGTLISAILCLLKQKWRTAVNRSAEAMTIFAVICAGTFPAIHVGRIWFIWFVFPIPNYNYIWPNFRSPLLWDVFAVSTYATVSLLFWFMGMIPDFATLRDRADKRLRLGVGGQKLLGIIHPDTIRAYAYGFFAMGWRGSSRHWHRYEVAYLILAGISTPLVLSVHSIVSFDFATSVVPGWHTTIFPPYFVAGAIFGGFAMVLLLLIPARELFPNFKDLLTLRHLENMAKILLVTGMMVGFAYSMEFFIAWYGGNEYELHVFLKNRVSPWHAPYWWAYWTMITCNVVSPQVFWFRKLRTNPLVIWIVALFVTVGMWFERFVIIVTSLHRSFLPGEWHMFHPTPVDIGIFIGSCGVFLTLFLLFLRFLPTFPIAEIKAVLPQADPHGHGAHAEKGAH